MRTETFTGELKWAQHLFKPDTYRGKSNWKATVVLDEESQAKFKTMQGEGVRLQMKDNTVGFKRPTEKKFSGEMKPFEAPAIYNSDGSAFEGMIGNGTKAEVTVQFYEYEFEGDKGLGSRLESVKVLDLVVYDPEGREITKNTSTSTEAKPWG